MLYVKLVCVGKLREKFYMEAFEEYRKRLGAYCRFECVEIAEQRLSDAPTAREVENALEREGTEVLRAIPSDAWVCALCVEGKQIPSEGVAELIATRENSGKPKLCFLIGGSYGLAPAVKKCADSRLSFSMMTFPHHLARVILVEQLYRGFKILEGSRYHK